MRQQEPRADMQPRHPLGNRGADIFDDIGRLHDAARRLAEAEQGHRVLLPMIAGAVSCISAIATRPIAMATAAYQAGTSTLPVRLISPFTANWVEPPKTEIDTA